MTTYDPPDAAPPAEGANVLAPTPSTPDAPTRPGADSFLRPSFNGTGFSSRVIRLTPGTIVNNRFKILSELGAGGMGVVYKILDLHLNQVRALKAMLPEFVDDDAMRKRFRNEVALCQNLTHEHIVRVYDFGHDPISGCEYFTMQFVEGRSLHSFLHLECGGRLPVDEAIRIMDQLCDGIEYAHDTTIHRDLKPHNVMLDKNNDVVILDFGLGKLADPQRTVASSVVMGTAHYRSPEQLLRPEKVDSRTDIWSLGVILYELITGEVPLGTYDPPSAIVPNAPKGIDAVVAKCLRPRPENRYQSAAELREALRNARQRRPYVRGVLITTALATLLTIGIITATSLLPPSPDAGASAGSPVVTTPENPLELATVADAVRPADAGHEPETDRPITSELEPPPLSLDYQNKTQHVDVGNGVTMSMMYIPPGMFTRGSPLSEAGRSGDENPHQVTLTRGFWMGKHEVTQAQWEHVIGNRPGHGREDVLDDPNAPVVFVSWDDAVLFTKRLSELTERPFRLPTEAEWEYACRTGRRSPYWYGDHAGFLTRYAWCGVNAYKGGEPYAHVVGLKRPNPWGLHDMYGNVNEWCQDYYGLYPAGPVVDPTGPESGNDRVIRGGSYGSFEVECRSASRDWSPPEQRDSGTGFRVVYTDDGA